MHGFWLWNPHRNRENIQTERPRAREWNPRPSHCEASLLATALVMVHLKANKQDETQILLTLSNMFSILVILFPGLTDWWPLWQSHCAMPCWGLGLSHSFYVTYGPSCPHKPWPRQRQTQWGIWSSVPAPPTLTHLKRNVQKGHKEATGLRHAAAWCFNQPANNWCCWGFHLVCQQKYFPGHKCTWWYGWEYLKNDWMDYVSSGLNRLAVSSVWCYQQVLLCWRYISVVQCLVSFGCSDLLALQSDKNTCLSLTEKKNLLKNITY